MSFCSPLVHITYIVVEISSTPTLFWGSLWFKILTMRCYSAFLMFFSVPTAKFWSTAQLCQHPFHFIIRL